MYKVIGMPQSRAGRVIWALEELGETYEIVAVRPHAAEARAHNPSGKIPVLLEPDGHALIDSIAICQYLADRHGQLTFKAGSRERARQDSFTQFAADDLETPLWTAAKHSFVLPKEQRVKEIKPSCRWEFARSLEALSERLGDGPYLMGETFTIADLMMVNCIRWSKAAEFDEPPSNLRLYVERVSARPACVRAIAKGML